MIFNYDKIPTDLRNLNRWVLWKLSKDKHNRTTKIPINAKTGYGAKSNDSETWTSFDYAINQIEKYNCNGLGFMLGNGYFGVDIDHEIDNKELINEFVDTLQSYTEISQSGEGIHIICKGILPVGARRKGHIEMYDSARFFALTGNVIKDDYEIVDRTKEIKELHEKYIEPKVVTPIVPQGGYVFKKEYSGNKVVANLTDKQVLDKAMESKNGALFNCLYYGQWEGLNYPSQSEADASFCSLLAFWCGKRGEQIDRIFRNSGLMRSKWDEKRGALTYGEKTINEAINKCKDVYMVNDNATNINFNPQTGLSRKTHKDYDLNDTGNAQRFVDRFGDGIKYNFDNKCWVIWDGKTWVKDIKQIVKSKVDIMIEEMKEDVVNESSDKIASELLKNIKRLSSNSGKEAMLKEAMHIGDIPTINADYDKFKYLLNCANGIVDLKNGTIIPHDKKYMMSKNTNIVCDLDNEPTLWKKTINDIFKGSTELIKFVKKAVGYSLTGDTKEQCLFQCYGNGSNGKSVFLNTLYRCLGDYIINSQVDSILTRHNASNGASSDIARMNGARFVRTNEPSEGARFNEGLIKQLTGGDTITARFLYGGEFEFQPEGKIWIACNSKINVRGTDKGIWRRMRLIPFEATFEGKNNDKNLETKLLLELPQILGWCVKGCLLWQKEGLEMPKEVEEATKEYREEMDIVETFCKDCVLERHGAREKASDVFNNYRTWAKNGNEYVMTQSKFGKELSKRYVKKHIGGYVYYLNIKLKTNMTPYIYEKEIQND